MPTRKNIEWCQQIAIKRGGKCLSTKYFNVGTKYLWECSNAHKWESKANNIQQGQWCPICSKSIHDIEWLTSLAASNGGECLSLHYKDVDAKYHWKCKEGHEWYTTASIIYQGSWCPVCVGSVHNLLWLKELAEKWNGKCLSVEYITGRVKYLWQCAQNHTWEATADKVHQGRWCPHCAGNATHNLSWIKELAFAKNGECLSNDYVNVATKYNWKCQYGHEWAAAANSIQQGIWCPYCAKRHSRSELEIFCFVKNEYPDTVSGQRGLLKSKRLELDIYVPSLKKAIEFDGIFWHKSEWATRHGVDERDARKNIQCKESGIDLLRITESDWIANKNDVYTRINTWLKS